MLFNKMISEITVLKELEDGGQKSVQLGSHPSLGKVVLKKGEINSFSSIERIRREVSILSEIDSDYFPKQHHFNVDFTNNEFLIVEQYIEGGTLRDNLNMFSDRGSIFKLIRSLIDGLSIIWDKNIVHRDLKPENIIIRPCGNPCIIDLGIARFLDLESLTKTLSPFGPCTPTYAAPEQLKNLKNAIDMRADFFALGVISLELYLKVHPFISDSENGVYSIVENILTNRYVTSTQSILEDNAISSFANKTIAPQPYQRFRNYEQIKNYLANYL